MKYFWFFSPTQLFIQGQWWSILLMQCLHILQWWALGGRYISHLVQIVQSSFGAMLPPSLWLSEKSILWLGRGTIPGSKKYIYERRLHLPALPTCQHRTGVGHEQHEDDDVEHDDVETSPETTWHSLEHNPPKNTRHQSPVLLQSSEGCTVHIYWPDHHIVSV